MKRNQVSEIAICWIRVDDRLIHGQITVAWRRHLGYDEIWIVDDSVRADPFLQDVLRMAVPSGVYIHMYTIQEAITTLKDVVPFAPPGQVPSPRKALLLLKAPQTALALFKGGVSMTPWGGKGPHLNVGNIAAAPGRKRVFRSISLGPEQAAALDALAAQGVRITFQSTPDDAQADWQATRQSLANALAR